MANVGHTLWGSKKKKPTCSRCGAWVLRPEVGDYNRRSGRKTESKIMCKKCKKESEK